MFNGNVSGSVFTQRVIHIWNEYQRTSQRRIQLGIYLDKYMDTEDV